MHTHAHTPPPTYRHTHLFLPQAMESSPEPNSSSIFDQFNPSSPHAQVICDLCVVLCDMMLFFSCFRFLQQNSKPMGLVICLFTHPHKVPQQAPLCMGFSRQEYWSGLLFLLQGIFPTQDSNPCLLHCRQILYRLSHEGSPTIKG